MTAVFYMILALFALALSLMGIMRRSLIMAVSGQILGVVTVVLILRLVFVSLAA